MSNRKPKAGDSNDPTDLAVDGHESEAPVENGGKHQHPNILFGFQHVSTILKVMQIFFMVMNRGLSGWENHIMFEKFSRNPGTKWRWLGKWFLWGDEVGIAESMRFVKNFAGKSTRNGESI